MSTIVVASGLPGGFSSAAALNVSFGSVLNWPANLVNKPVVVRASGSLIIPGGKYSGYLSVGISRQSDNSNLMGGGTGGFQQSGPPRAIPFRIVASVYADPFFGNILDVNAPASIFSQAGVPAALPFSGAVVGEAMDNSNPFATPIGGGALSFSSQVPLVVLASLYNSGGTGANPAASTDGSPVLPLITGQVTQFELEF